MNVKTLEEGVKIEAYEVIGILAHEAEPENISLDPLRGETRDFCRRCVVNENFRGKPGTSLKIPVADGAVKFVMLCGIGKCEDSAEESVREGAFRIVRAAASKGYEKVVLQAPKANEKVRSRSIAEGAVLANYRFDKYMKKEADDKFKAVENVVVIEGNEEGFSEGKVLAECQAYARDLANEPGNVINPEVLADKAEELAEAFGLECEIWDEEKIVAENMGAFYAVGRGSENPPRFIRLTWPPKGEAKKHIVLVGKGITFDSGGLDIKPADYMTTMKGDKSGACAVLGAIRAAAILNVPHKVTAIIAAAENMPGGAAYRPDDILTARNGKTIEINNTDAEGRLTLADALAFASELQPDAIVDIATLTGACAVALGSYTAGLFTNNDALGDKILEISKRTGERLWKLPMDDPNLRKQIKSPFADTVNSGSRYGGAITAAMFLEEFVGKDIPWVHLDIAAADFIKEPRGYYVKGASGFGARTLASLLMEC
ncbi:leucyl aminopeptidase [Synergistaceae bacterium OttesenSCG-928-D05]|nr:leucyl aminopeptidase [Synergistaceae bacterium OttesenSCG-928-D05]